MSNAVDRLRGVRSSQAIKVPCRVATTANVSLSGLQTIDSVTLVDRDRVLVKNQSSGAENGIYEASTGPWRRAPDWDGSGDIVTGTMVRVTGGTVGSGLYTVSTSGAITIDTTLLAFDFQDQLAINKRGYTISSVAALASIAVPIIALSAHAMGCTAENDGGSVILNRIATPSPAQAWHKQDATGAWFEFGLSPDGAINNKAFGTTWDGTSDDTDEHQDCIDFLASRSNIANGQTAWAKMPRGISRFTQINISRPARISGVDDGSTWLYQFSGIDDSAIKVRMAHDGFNYYAAGNPPADLTFDNWRLIGGNRLSGYTNNHGLDLQNASVNPVLCSVQLRDWLVREFAGNGLYGDSFSGWVEGYNVDAQYCTLSGLRANGCFDWSFSKSDFHSCGDGITLSGCGEFQFIACNRWSNTRGTVIFNGSGEQSPNHKFIGGMCDRSGQHGWSVDLRHASHVIHVLGESTMYNGQSGSNTYSEILMEAGCLGQVSTVACTFGRTYSQQTHSLEVSLAHVTYAGGGGVVLFDPQTKFVGGAAVLSHVRGTHSFLGEVSSNATGRALVARNSTDSASVVTAAFEGARASPATNDSVRVDFSLKNAAGTVKPFGYLTTVGTTLTDAAELGRLVFGVKYFGGDTSVLGMNGNSIFPMADNAINNGGASLRWANLFAMMLNMPRQTPPASAGATGVAGTFLIGTDDRIYYCYATNTWLRSAAMVTW